jgi:hypothetical protein
MESGKPCSIGNVCDLQICCHFTTQNRNGETNTFLAMQDLDEHGSSGTGNGEERTETCEIANTL